MIRCVIVVSNSTCWYFAVLGDLFCNVCVNNCILKSCFQQSTKCNTTAFSAVYDHVFITICISDCVLLSELQFSSSGQPLSRFLYLITHFTGGMVRTKRLNRCKRSNRLNLARRATTSKIVVSCNSSNCC